VENQRSERNEAASGRDLNGRLIALLVVVVVVVLLILANGEETQIDFMFFEWETTVRWAFFIAVILGVILDRLAMWLWRRRKRNND